MSIGDADMATVETIAAKYASATRRESGDDGAGGDAGAAGASATGGAAAETSASGGNLSEASSCWTADAAGAAATTIGRAQGRRKPGGNAACVSSMSEPRSCRLPGQQSARLRGGCRTGRQQSVATTINRRLWRRVVPVLSNGNKNARAPTRKKLENSFIDILLAAIINI
jgi:hypothetical protein